MGRGRQGGHQDVAAILLAPILSGGQHLAGKGTVEQDHCLHLCTWVQAGTQPPSASWECKAMGESWMTHLEELIPNVSRAASKAGTGGDCPLLGSQRCSLPRLGCHERSEELLC